MPSRDTIFWEVDAQADFMLPGGKLYVPGAEKLLPNIRKLTDAARRGEVFLVSHGDFHPANDPEFRQFPPHCLKARRERSLFRKRSRRISFAWKTIAKRRCRTIYANISKLFWKTNAGHFCIETRRRIGGALRQRRGICGVWSSDRILREFRGERLATKKAAGRRSARRD